MTGSGFVSIGVSPQSIFNINITNTQNTATPVPFQQMIKLPVSQLGLINPYIRNIGPLRFSYNGSYIPAWLESISNGVVTIWIKLPVSIPANSSITIDMKVNPLLNFDGNYLGEAPQLSSTYGQYDNGASVFNMYFNRNLFTSEFLTGGGGTLNQPTGINLPNGASRIISNFKAIGVDPLVVVDEFNITTIPNLTNYYISEASFEGESLTGTEMNLVNILKGVTDQYHRFLIDYNGSYQGAVSVNPIAVLSGWYRGFWEIISAEIYHSQLNWFRVRAYTPNGVMPIAEVIQL